MKTTKQFLMALFAMMLCAGISSCGNEDEVTDGGGKEKGHEYVDLGLPSGTLWATCNIGADVPAAPGNYYAWGETKPKSEYTYENYMWSTGEWQNFTKYCNAKGYGTVDNRLTLEKADDAAAANWGGKWRMATYKEWKELVEYCHLYTEELNGVKGIKVLAPNGNSIFLPKAGCYNSYGRDSDGAFYWTSSIDPESNCQVYFYCGSIDKSRDSRYYGGSIRAVIGK